MVTGISITKITFCVISKVDVFIQNISYAHEQTCVGVVFCHSKSQQLLVKKEHSKHIKHRKIQIVRYPNT